MDSSLAPDICGINEACQLHLSRFPFIRENTYCIRIKHTPCNCCTQIRSKSKANFINAKTLWHTLARRHTNIVDSSLSASCVLELCLLKALLLPFAIDIDFYASPLLFKALYDTQTLATHTRTHLHIEDSL